MLPLTAHAEGDAADDDCEDRKPAAKPAFVSSHNNKNDEMDGDDDSSSSSNHCRNSNGEQHHVEEGDKPPMVTSSASVAAASAAVATTDEGHRLSNYELQRLERIKRNRQYLEQLGLEGKGKRGVISSSLDHPNPVKHKRTRNNAAPDVARRSSMSRQSKLKSVNYAEPTASVRALMKTGAQNKKKKSLVEAKINTEKKTAAATAEKAKNDRMDQIIYMEFNRIKREKNQLLKTASRNVRLAQKEVKYWTRLESVWERREERRLEHQRQQAAEAMQKACLGGKTTKELLKDLDDKMPTILQAMKNFDDSILVRLPTLSVSLGSLVCVAVLVFLKSQIGISIGLFFVTSQRAVYSSRFFILFLIIVQSTGP